VTRNHIYRLRKTVGNKTAFAAVTLQVTEPSRNKAGRIRVDSAESDREWFRAAVCGVRPVADFIASYGTKLTALEIKVSKVEGNPSDTTNDFIECVAGLATWRALAPDSWPEPEIAKEGRWVLKYRILPSLSA
jgi:hypothetical protein